MLFLDFDIGLGILDQPFKLTPQVSPITTAYGRLSKEKGYREPLTRMKIWAVGMGLHTLGIDGGIVFFKLVKSPPIEGNTESSDVLRKTRIVVSNKKHLHKVI